MGRNPQYSDSFRMKVLADVTNGVSMTEAARKHGCSRHAIRSWARKFGIDEDSIHRERRYFSPRKYSQEMREKVLSSYLSGKTTWEVSDEFGIPRTTIWRWCKEENVLRDEVEHKSDQLSLDDSVVREDDSTTEEEIEDGDSPLTANDLCVMLGLFDGADSDIDLYSPEAMALRDFTQKSRLVLVQLYHALRNIIVLSERPEDMSIFQWREVKKRSIRSLRTSERILAGAFGDLMTSYKEAGDE